MNIYPSQLEIDLQNLSLVTKTAEGFTLKTSYFRTEQELMEAAKIININMLRALELKQ